MQDQYNKNDIFELPVFRRDMPKFPDRAFGYLFRKVEAGETSFEDFFREITRKDKSTWIIETFLKSNRTSEPFLQFLLKKYSNDLRNVVRETRAFYTGVHRQLIADVFSEDPAFSREMDCWRKIWTELDRETTSVRPLLAKYNFEDTLLLCGFYYDKQRLLLQVHRNQDASIIETINLILSEKIRTVTQNKKVVAGKYTPEAFRERALNLLARLTESGDEDLQKLFHVYDRKAEIEFMYQQYCYHGFQISFSADRTVLIKPDDETRYLRFKKAGERYQLWSAYYHNVVYYEHDEIYEELEKREMSWYNKRGNIRTWEHLFQFLEAGFPAEIETEHGEVSANQCLLALNSLGMWTNIRWNNFIEDAILHGGSNRPYEFMRDCIVHNLARYGNDALPVFFRSYSALLKQSDEINGLKKETSRKALPVFTNNIQTQTQEPVNVSNKPFVKNGRNIYWIAGILSNRNYAVMLQNIVLDMDKKQSEDGARNRYAKRAEENLAGWFQRNEFLCLPGFPHADGSNREIDLLAFRDNTLFICQVKSTFYRTTIQEIHSHFTDERTGIKKAIKQLSHDLVYIRNNWEVIADELGVVCPLEKLTIVPLAITTTLEPGDGQFNVEGIKGYIVPLFEMNVILADTKFYLFNISDLALRAKFRGGIPVRYLNVLTGIHDDPSITKEITEIVFEYIEKSKPQFTLKQEGSRFISANDIIRALENEWVWDMITLVPRITMRRVALGELTVNYMT